MNTVRTFVRRPATSLILIAVLTFLLCAAQEQLMPTFPQIQDEFSYLLAADTFSEGRLTNSTHPLWRYFETTHVVHQPTYQSKYPPGQGLALALGQVLTGSPLIGVWLSFSLACAAVCWMLQAWLPLRWAFLGGFFAAANVGNLRFWGGTFMGGAVAMLGGAVLFGALARSLKDPRPQNGIVLASGVLILAVSRPYEGLIACLPVAVVLLAWVVRQKEFSARMVWKRLMAPIMITLTLGACWLGYYNYRLTGDAFQMPYQVYLERYGHDVFFNPQAKPINRQRVDDVTEQIRRRFDLQFIHHMGGKRYYAVFILVALRSLLKSRWARFALMTSILTLLASSITRGAVPHYSAPIAALTIGLVVQSLAIIASWIRWRVAAVAAVGAFVGLYLVNNYVHFMGEVGFWEYKQERSRIVAQPEVPIPDVDDLDRVEERQQWQEFSRLGMLARRKYVDQFERDEERHLVVVRYAPNTNRHREWVYNRAEIDDAASVWALWLEDKPLWPLLTYFKDRRVWLVEPERDPWEMLPFPVEEVGAWHLRKHEGAEATILPTPTADDPVRVEITWAGLKHWNLQIERAHPPLEEGRMYLGAFRARADAPRNLGVHVTRSQEPWANLGLRRQVHLTANWNTFNYGFRATRDEAIPRLAFNFGGSDVPIEIEAVRMSPGG